MKIYRAGLPVQYVDEAPPVGEVPKGPAPLPSVDEAIRLAQARAGVTEVPQTPAPEKQVLQFTRERGAESPLLDNSQGVANPDNISGRLEHGTVETPVVPTGTSEDSPPADVESDPLTQ